MLGTEATPIGPVGRASSASVAAVFRDRVAPCGIEALRRLEALVGEKLAHVQELEVTPADEFAGRFGSVVDSIPAARPHRSRLIDATSRVEVQAVLRSAREGYLGPVDLPEVTHRLAGGPEDVRRDVASELLHAAAPDRVALLARWVWNPARGTGALREFGEPVSESYAGAQTRLGEIRLELGALGFPCPTFAGVDVVLALAYAARLQTATDDRLRSGGLESLLPGPFPLATMILGVRRRRFHADR